MRQEAAKLTEGIGNLSVRRIDVNPEVEQLRRIVADLIKVRELQETHITELKDFIEELIDICHDGVAPDRKTLDWMTDKMTGLFKCGCTTKEDSNGV